jgi:hypothetical protein
MDGGSGLNLLYAETYNAMCSHGQLYDRLALYSMESYPSSKLSLSARSTYL